MLTFNRF